MEDEKAKVLQRYEAFKRTSVKYEPKVKEIMHYIKEFVYSSNKSLNKFSEQELVDYLNSKGKYAVRTINDIKVYLKTFIKWYYEDWSSRFRNLDKLCRNETPPSAYKPEQMLSKEDIQTLVQEENSPFWKAFWLTLFYGGMRPIEICSLTWKQVIFEEDGAFITIYSKKNNKDFIKFIPQDVAFYLKKLQTSNSELVFPSNYRQRKNMPMATNSVYCRLVKLSQKALHKKINPYLLRHSIATLLYEEAEEGKLNDDVVARQMGHSKSMKNTYKDSSKNVLKQRAKEIWIKPEATPEKKLELEKVIQEQNKRLEEHEKLMKKLWNALQSEDKTLSKAEHTTRELEERWKAINSQ